VTSASFSACCARMAPRSVPPRTSPLNTIWVSKRSLSATLRMPPPVPSGSSSTTYSMSRPRSEPSPKCSSKTSALYDVPSTTCVMPAARMRPSRCSRKGTPAVGSIGFGVPTVRGRRRVPWPPTRITASVREASSAASGVVMVRGFLLVSTGGRLTAADSCPELLLTLLHGQDYAATQGEAYLQGQPDGREPRSGEPVRHEPVGGIVVGADGDLRVRGRRMPLRVPDFGGRGEDVPPAGAAHPVAEVDVLHVHEVAGVEAADGVER